MSTSARDDAESPLLPLVRKTMRGPIPLHRVISRRAGRTLRHSSCADRQSAHLVHSAFLAGHGCRDLAIVVELVEFAGDVVGPLCGLVSLPAARWRVGSSSLLRRSAATSGASPIRPDTIHTLAHRLQRPRPRLKTAARPALTKALRPRRKITPEREGPGEAAKDRDGSRDYASAAHCPAVWLDGSLAP